MKIEKKLRSPVCYFGGKSHLRNKIIERFPEHLTYCEPFFGAGWIFFSKPRSKYEIINDVYDEISNLFHVLQVVPHEFIQLVRTELHSRKSHEIYKNQDPEELSNLLRAKRLYYLLKTSFGGIIRNASFKFMKKTAPSLIPEDFEDLILRVHERLRKVVIENRCFREIIPRCNDAKTLIYADPPYYCPGARSYMRSLKKEDFIDLRDLLASHKGQFLLSINDHPFIRDLYRDYFIEEILVSYNITGHCGKVSKVGELLIRNFDV